MLTYSDMFLAFALGALAVAPLAGWLWWRALKAGRAAERHRAEAEWTNEILAASPDGVYLWDLAGGGESCSRRLAVLLDLADGTESRFGDVLARFEGTDRAALNEAVGGLRRDGTTFDLVLAAGNSRRLVRGVGARTGDAGGRPLADIVWMRDAAPGPGRPSAAAEEPLEAILDAVALPFWLRGEDLAVTFANRAAAGKDVAGPSAALAARAVAEGRSLTERHLFTIDGAPRMLEVTETPLAGGRGTAGFAVDRSAAEERDGEFARHASARDAVLESLATAIAIFDPDARLVFANSAYARLWRLDAGWLATGPGLGEVLDRLREQRRLPEVADFRAFKEEQLGRFGTLDAPAETFLHLPDGATLRGLVSPHARGGLVFAFEDVTDRLDLERSFKTLNAVQRATLDNLYEGVAVFGSDGRLKLSNPAFANLWNLAQQDLAGEPHMADLVEMMRPFLAGGDDWPALKDRIIARLIGREPETGRLERTDHKVVDYANVPLPDGAVLLSYLDVTDSVRVELALRQRAEALQEADRLKSEFIANVSHEVRTPLTSMIGFAEILTAGYFGELNKRQEEYSRGILEASQGLMSVIGDILDLASIEAGILELELDTVDIHAMLVSVLNLTRERARRKTLDLKFECPPDIGWIVADERRLKQVLFNLLSNAVRFTPPRGTVSLEAGREGSEAVFTVTDTGVGFSQADLDRYLRPFERGDSPEARQGGSGLGLSLVKSFIELHDGRVEIKSAAGKGTRVTCRLPAGGSQEG